MSWIIFWASQFFSSHPSLLYFGLQQYSKTHGCSERLPSALPIHNMHLLRALSYLIWLTHCASVLLSASKEPVLSLSPGLERHFGVYRQRERQRANHKVATVTTLGSQSLLLVNVREQTQRPAFICQIYRLQWWAVTFFFFRLRGAMNDKMCHLFVFVWFAFCRSLASLSSSAPLWSRAHFCFVSLNIALIVALTEVKPLLISFVYIVGDTERERGRERESTLERRRGCDSDCSVWQRPSPVGVGRRERRLVFCLWQSGKSCHGESLGLPSGFLRLFCSQPAFEILSVTEHNTLQPCNRTNHAATIHTTISPLFFQAPQIKGSKPDRETCLLNIVLEENRREWL